MKIKYDLVNITKIKGKFNSRFGKDTALYKVDLKFKSSKYDSVFIEQFGKVATSQRISFTTPNKNLIVYDVDGNILNQSVIKNMDFIMNASTVIMPKLEEFPSFSRQEVIRNPVDFAQRARKILNNYFTMAYSDEKNNFITFFTIYKKSIVDNVISFTSLKVRFPVNPKPSDLYEIAYLTKESKMKDSEIHEPGDEATEISKKIMIKIIKMLNNENSYR